jgi:hypothetical protein
VWLRDLPDAWFNAYDGPDVLMAELTQGSNPCAFNYVKFAGRTRVEPTFIFPDADTWVTTDEKGQGSISLGNACVVTPAGAKFISKNYRGYSVPFYFTDAAGRKTLEPSEVENVADDLGLAALTGKIVFRDPTFGGVFPGLTNDNIWSTIQSLDAVGPRLGDHCDESGLECTREIPNNPSDLDVWAHYLFWLDNLF